MRLNTTVVLTLLLLLTMSGAGTASALWGFRIGRAALTSVRQPDVSPTRRLAGGDSDPNLDEDGLNILPESEILVKVYDYVYAQEHGGEAPTTSPGNEAEENKTQVVEDGEEESQPEPELNLPIKSQDQGVTMEVTNVTRNDGSLVLDVNLNNEGSQAVRFLYSFLEVNNDQGQPLSAITDGLPGELPATGRSFSGTVKIPEVLLNDTKSLSISLTDYPDQKLQLSLAEIPVVE